MPAKRRQLRALSALRNKKQQQPENDDDDDATSNVDGNDEHLLDGDDQDLPEQGDLQQLLLDENDDDNQQQQQQQHQEGSAATSREQSKNQQQNLDGSGQREEGDDIIEQQIDPELELDEEEAQQQPAEDEGATLPEIEEGEEGAVDDADDDNQDEDDDEDDAATRMGTPSVSRSTVFGSPAPASMSQQQQQRIQSTSHSQRAPIDGDTELLMGEDDSSSDDDGNDNDNDDDEEVDDENQQQQDNDEDDGKEEAGGSNLSAAPRPPSLSVSLQKKINSESKQQQQNDAAPGGGDNEEGDDDEDDEDDNADGSSARFRALALNQQYRSIDAALMPANARILGFSYEPIPSSSADTAAANRRRQRQNDDNNAENTGGGDEDSKLGAIVSSNNKTNDSSSSSSSSYTPYRNTSSMLGLRCFEPAATNRRQTLLQHASYTPHPRKVALGSTEDVVAFNESRAGLLCECIRYYQAFSCFVGLPDRCRVALRFVVSDERNLPLEDEAGVPVIMSHAPDVYRWCLESLASIVQGTFSTMATCAVVIRAAMQPTAEEAAHMDGAEPGASLAAALLGCMARTSNSMLFGEMMETRKVAGGGRVGAAAASSCGVNKKVSSVMQIPTSARKQARDALAWPLVDNPLNVGAGDAARQQRIVDFLRVLFDALIEEVEATPPTQQPSQQEQQQQQQSTTSTTTTTTRKRSSSRSAAASGNSSKSKAKTDESVAASSTGKTSSSTTAPAVTGGISCLDTILDRPARLQAVQFLRRGRELLLGKLVPLLQGGAASSSSSVKSSNDSIIQQLNLSPLVNPSSHFHHEQQQQQQHHHHHHHSNALNLRFSQEHPPFVALASSHLRGDTDTITTLERAFSPFASSSAALRGGASASSTPDASSISLAGVPSSIMAPLALLLDLSARVARAVDERVSTDTWRRICRLVASVASPFVAIRFLLPFGAMRGGGSSSSSSVWADSVVAGRASSATGLHQSTTTTTTTTAGKDLLMSSVATTTALLGNEVSAGAGAVGVLSSGGNTGGSHVIAGIQTWLGAQIRAIFGGAAGTPARSVHLACLSHLPRIVSDLLVISGRAAVYSGSVKSFFAVREAFVARGIPLNATTTLQQLVCFAECVRVNSGGMAAITTREDGNDDDENESQECQFFVGGRGDRLFVGVYE